MRRPGGLEAGPVLVGAPERLARGRGDGDEVTARGRVDRRTAGPRVGARGHVLALL